MTDVQKVLVELQSSLVTKSTRLLLWMLLLQANLALFMLLTGRVKLINL